MNSPRSTEPKSDGLFRFERATKNPFRAPPVGRSKSAFESVPLYPFQISPDPYSH